MSRSPSWLKALKDLGKRTIAPTDIKDILDTIAHDPNDRGVALSLGSIVENALYVFVRSWVTVPLDKTEENQLFGGDAPLGTFSSRIRVAYAFGLISSEVRSNLDLIREIRNTFAHSALHIGFTTPEVEVACLKLDIGSGGKLSLTGARSPGRGAYISMSGLLLHALVNSQRRQQRPPAKLPVTFNDTLLLIQNTQRPPSSDTHP